MSLLALRNEVRRLAERLRQAARPAAAREEPRTHADRLAYFVKHSEFMLQRGELDWPGACRGYADAIAAGDDQRLADAHHWLLAMVNRCLEGVSPSTLAEWSELTAWFEANLERLHEVARAN